MSSRFIYQRRVAFADTDMAGIVHFANFYRYMEEAEHALFRSLGRRPHHAIEGEEQPDGSVLGWPRVDTSCRYKAPAFYNDLIDIHVSVERIGVKSLTFRHEFLRDETLLAVGTMKIVPCVFRPGEAMTSVEVPEDLLAKLQPEE